MNVKETKLRIIAAGHKAVEQLIKIAEEAIIKHDPEDDLSADKLKNAAATKKLAVFDAFEILNRIELERENLESEEKGVSKTDTKQGFAERRSK
jgi:ASC-1-like (ASCH) protein